jgi:hypothetical protein
MSLDEFCSYGNIEAFNIYTNTRDIGLASPFDDGAVKGDLLEK